MVKVSDQERRERVIRVRVIGVRVTRVKITTVRVVSPVAIHIYAIQRVLTITLARLL